MTNPAIQHVLQFFDYKHLPPHLAQASAEFEVLAVQIAHRAPDSPETTVALRKLLEAKDAAVRAAVEAHKGSAPKPELTPSELPRYKCHKEVGAFKITGLAPHPSQAIGMSITGGLVTALECRDVSQAFINKHNPKVGDYFVEYDGGYVSISPAKAFEEGYTLITAKEPETSANQKAGRELHGHEVNECNEKLRITVSDQPGDGGACHAYHIGGYDVETNASKHHLAGPQKPHFGTSILFQNGPIPQKGVNGVTHEALLAIVVDRLVGFQNGPFACEANGLALARLQGAMQALHSRTEGRMARGVEGTHEA